MGAYADLFFGFALGFVVTMMVVILVSLRLSKATKSRFENPLTAAQKRRIREFAKEETGHDFLWGRDGKLAIWK